MENTENDLNEQQRRQLEINSNREIIEKLQKEIAEKQKERTDNEAYLNSDEYVQEYFNKNSITNTIASKVYKGRRVNILQTNANNIIINQYNREIHLEQGDNYNPLTINLSTESFILLLETMLFSVKKFNIDKEIVIADLTSGKESKDIDFEETITVANYFI